MGIFLKKLNLRDRWIFTIKHMGWERRWKDAKNVRRSAICTHFYLTTHQRACCNKIETNCSHKMLWKMEKKKYPSCRVITLHTHSSFYVHIDWICFSLHFSVCCYFFHIFLYFSAFLLPSQYVHISMQNLRDVEKLKTRWEFIFTSILHSTQV